MLTNHPFKPGDKVRLLRSKETGEVLQVYPNGKLLVLVDNVFDMELSIEDIVSTDPDKHVRLEQSPAKVWKQPHGVYLGITKESSLRLKVYLINHSEVVVLYTLLQNVPPPTIDAPLHFLGKLAGKLDPFTVQPVFSAMPDAPEFNSSLMVQLLFMPLKPSPLVMPFESVVKLRAKLLTKSPEQTPYLPEPAILKALILTQDLCYHFQQSYNNVRIELEQSPSSETISLPPPPEPIVDLHLSSLNPPHANLRPEEILQLQLETFEQKLSLAHAHNMSQIIFIHGVGSGRLKAELQVRLDKLPFVVGYEPEDPLKYGGGAIKVIL